MEFRSQSGATDILDVIKNESSWCKYLRDNCQQILNFFFWFNSFIAVSVFVYIIIRWSILCVSMSKWNSIFSCSVRKVYWHWWNGAPKANRRRIRSRHAYVVLFCVLFQYIYYSVLKWLVSGDQTWCIILLFIGMTQLYITNNDINSMQSWIVNRESVIFCFNECSDCDEDWKQ